MEALDNCPVCPPLNPGPAWLRARVVRRHRATVYLVPITSQQPSEPKERTKSQRSHPSSLTYLSTLPFSRCDSTVGRRLRPPTMIVWVRRRKIINQNCEVLSIRQLYTMMHTHNVSSS